MPNNIIIEVNGINKAKASTWKNARRKLVDLTKDMDFATATVFDTESGTMRGYLHRTDTGLAFTGGTGQMVSPVQTADVLNVLNGYTTANEGISKTISKMVHRELPMLVQDVHVDEYICPACGAENSHCEEGRIMDMFCPVCGQRLEVLPLD